MREALFIYLYYTAGRSVPIRVVWGTDLVAAQLDSNMEFV